MAAKVEVYSIVNCPFCTWAKALLRRKNVDFIEHDLTELPTLELRERMMALAGRRTVPQIVIDGQSIGGCEDLFALQESGELDELLRAGEA